MSFTKDADELWKSVFICDQIAGPIILDPEKKTIIIINKQAHSDIDFIIISVAVVFWWLWFYCIKKKNNPDSFPLAFSLLRDLTWLTVVMGAWGCGVGAFMSIYSLIMVEYVGLDQLVPTLGVSGLFNSFGFLVSGTLTGKWGVVRRAGGRAWAGWAGVGRVGAAAGSLGQRRLCGLCTLISTLPQKCRIFMSSVVRYITCSHSE